MEFEEGDLVLCVVDRIVGTTVFVKIPEFENIEGSIVTSEIAPGRIRNLRDYVVPKKQIVCKVLRVSEGRIDLSLRRVSQKEKKEILEQYQQEKSYKSILKSVVGEKSDRIIEEISKKEKLYDFFDEAKNNPKKLEEFMNKTEAEKILEILSTQKQKKALIKKEISLKTTKPNGLELIREILGNIKEIEIKYLSAGRYILKIESTDLKKADNKLKELISQIEAKAKKLGLEFSVK